MQPNPKKVKRNEDKDYAQIYQENFLAQNDPAPLGQAAYNRQLSDGVRKRLGEENLASSGQTSVGTTSATQRAGYSPFDNAAAAMQRREGAMARAQLAEAGLGGGSVPPSLETMGQNFVGSTSATQRAGYSPVDTAGMAMQRQREIQGLQAQAEARANEIRLGNSSATQLAGYSPVDNAGRILDTRAGLQAQRDARAQQLRLGDPSATALAGYSQAQDRRRDQIQSDIYARQNEIRGGQMARLQEVANLQKQRDARAQEVDLERRLGPSSVSATAGAGYSQAQDRRNELYAGLQAQRDAREQEVEYNAMNENQRAGYGIAGDIFREQEEARAAEAQRAFEERRGAAEGLQIQREAAEAAARERALAGVTPDTTPDPYDGPDDDDGGPEDDDGNKITLSGATASYDNGITQQEEILNQQLDAEENAVLQEFNQKYNQFMQLAVNRGAVRGNLESQGFTGGIGQQIEDFLSTQEMIAFNQLISEKDQALEAIRLERNNIPNAAKANYLQSLELENASIQAQTAFSQMISQKVLDGSMSLAEANGLAQEYGLQDVQSVFQSAITAQIASGEMNKTIAKAELERLGLDASFLDKVGGSSDFTDFSLTPEAGELEEEIKNILDETGNSFDNMGVEDWIARLGVVGGTTLIGAKLGSFIPIPGVGTAIGVVAGLGVGLAAQFGAQRIDSNDFTKAGASLFKSEFMLEQGSALMNGQFESIKVAKPAGQSSAFGGLDSTFIVNIDGQEYQLKGTDITILAAVLKKKGYSQTDSRYSAIFTQAAKANREYDNFSSFGAGVDTILGNQYFVVSELYKTAFS